MSAARPLYPEGGCRGWMIVFDTFLSKFIVLGSLKAFGVFLPIMHAEFDTGLWIVGSISSLHFGVQFILSPVAAILACKVGSRCVILVGGLLYGLGLVLASIATELIALAVCLVLLAGSGAACVMGPVHAEINFYFHERYALASILALSGSPLGIMLYGPMAQVLADTYGWRGAMLLLGGAGCFLFPCGMVIRRPKPSYSRITENGASSMDDESRPMSSGWEAADAENEHKTCSWSSFLLITGIDIFGNVEFLVVTLSRMLYCICFSGLAVYIVSSGLSMGLSPNQASYLTTAWGVGSLAGITLASLALHAKLLRYYTVAMVGGILGAVCLAVDHLVPKFPAQMVILTLVGVGLAILSLVNNVATRDLPFSDERFYNIIGWQNFLAGVSSSLGGVASGWIYNAIDSFQITYIMLGANLVASALCLVWAACIKQQKQD